MLSTRRELLLQKEQSSRTQNGMPMNAMLFFFLGCPTRASWGVTPQDVSNCFHKIISLQRLAKSHNNINCKLILRKGTACLENHSGKACYSTSSKGFTRYNNSVMQSPKVLFANVGRILRLFISSPLLQASRLLISHFKDLLQVAEGLARICNDLFVHPRAAKIKTCRPQIVGNRNAKDWELTGADKQLTGKILHSGSRVMRGSGIGVLLPCMWKPCKTLGPGTSERMTP